MKNVSYTNPTTTPRKSAKFDEYTLSEIRRAAATGLYDIRGAGAKRKVPGLDDLLFLGASMSRYPLEGYREKCGTEVVLGNRFAEKPLALKIPITIAGMSFGSLSGNAKEALGRGATLAGTSTTTGAPHSRGGQTAHQGGAGGVYADGYERPLGPGLQHRSHRCQTGFHETCPVAL